MNRLVLSAAVAAACGLLCGNASAVNWTDYTANDTNTLELKYGGASAQDVALEKALAILCTSGTLTGISTTNQSFYYCSIANGTPIPGVTIGGITTATKLALWKSSVGGSGNGATPIAAKTNLTFLNVTTIKNNTAAWLGAVTNYAVSGSIPAYTMTALTGAGTSSTLTAVADAGLTDVEPYLLGVTAANILKLTSTEGAHLTFGVPVNVTLRNQLQTDQGLTVGDESEAQQPSLSKTQIAALLNGSITNFNQLSQNPDSAKRIPSNPVNLAIRSAGSGTTRVTNAYFGTDGAQCVYNAKPRATATTGDQSGVSCTNSLTTPTVMYGSGTDTVFICMNNHNTAGRPAIGVASLETSTSAGTAGANQRFIKVDGQSPTLANVVNGRYGLWASVAFNYRNGSATPADALGGEKKSFTDTIKAALVIPTVLKAVNGTITHRYGAAGDFGYLAPPTSPIRTLPVFDLSTDLSNAWTKTIGSQNNCLVGVR